MTHPARLSPDSPRSHRKRVLDGLAAVRLDQEPLSTVARQVANDRDVTGHERCPAGHGLDDLERAASLDQVAIVGGQRRQHRVVLMVERGQVGLWHGSQEGHGRVERERLRRFSGRRRPRQRAGCLPRGQCTAVEREPAIPRRSLAPRGEPASLRIPDLDAYTAAFSPDGTRIVTASHNTRDSLTGKMTYSVVVWPTFERFTDLSDPTLWTATRYCPPVSLRKNLLGTPEDLAADHLASCQARVKAAFAARAARH